MISYLGLLPTLRIMCGYQMIKLFGYQIVELIKLKCGTGILLGGLSSVTSAAEGH